MKPATIADIGPIMTILQQTYGDQVDQGLAYSLSIKMKTGTNAFFLNDQRDAVLLFEHIGSKKMQFHIYSLPSARGKSLMRFVKMVARWILKNTEFTSFMTFVPKRDKRAQRLAGYMGLRRVAEIEDAIEPGVSEYLYTTTREKFMQRKEKGSERLPVKLKEVV